MRGEGEKKRATRLGVIKRAELVISLTSSDDSPGPHLLKRYLADRSPRVQAFALDAVRKHKIYELKDQVLNLLSHPSYHTRYAAAECIGSLFEGEGLSASWLYPLLADSAVLVQIETLESLVQIGDKQALSLIAERLQDNDPLVRSYAAWAIAELGGDSYMAAIGQALEKERAETARQGFREALFNLGDDAQFPLLLEFLLSADYRIRCAGANGLAAAQLTRAQLHTALIAIANAAESSLFRADRTTMERVLEELRARDNELLLE